MTQKLPHIWAQARSPVIGKLLFSASPSWKVPSLHPDSLTASSGLPSLLLYTLRGQIPLCLGFLSPTFHLRNFLSEDGFGPKHQDSGTEHGLWGTWPLKQEIMSVLSVTLGQTRQGRISHGPELS